MEDKSFSYSLGEEIFSCVSHGVGALFAAAGGAVAIVLAALSGSGWNVGAAIVYTVSMFLMYLSSTLYHAFPWPGVKRIFRIFDHSSIFIFIAGCYTPYCLVTLRGTPAGVAVFAAVWGAALGGMLLEIFALGRFKVLSMLCYLATGWAVVWAMGPLVERLDSAGVWLLIVGGLFYTGGVAFYMGKKVRYFHGIWHLFVLAGTIFQYLSIVIYVLPYSR